MPSNPVPDEGNWLRDEIAAASSETERWPEWMRDPRLWHDSLGERAALDEGIER